MAAIFKRNLSLINTKIYSILIMLVCVFIFFIVIWNNNWTSIDNLYFLATGSSNNSITFLLISMSLVINFTYLYFTYILYEHDLSYDKETIFLRIHYKNWILTTILSNFVVTFFVLIITTFFIFLFSILFGIHVKMTISIFLLTYLSKIFLSLLFIFLLKKIRKYSLIFMTVILSISFLFNTPSIIYVSSLLKFFNPIQIILIQVMLTAILIIVNIFSKDRNLIIESEENV